MILGAHRAARPRRALLASLFVALSLVAAPASSQSALAQRLERGWSASLAADTNPRRLSTGAAGGMVPLLGVQGWGRWTWAAERDLLQLSARAGAKLHPSVPAEDLLAGALSLRWTHALGPGLRSAYLFRWDEGEQRGDALEAVARDPLLQCAPPVGKVWFGYRCNRRDHRRLELSASLDLALGRDLVFRASAALESFTYKADDAFSFGGPAAHAALAWRPAVGHQLSLSARTGARIYHPVARTYRRLPDGSLGAGEAPRRLETLLEGQLRYGFEGPALASATLGVSRTLNNSAALDALRLDLGGELALPLGPRGALVLAGGLSFAAYPDGYALNSWYDLGDGRDEALSHLGLRYTQALGGGHRLALELRRYGAELSSGAPPFDRLLFTVGVEAGP